MSESVFNLPAPPGFRGLQPHQPIESYRRHLPHWRQQGATYFVTFRLADAIPQEKSQFLQRLRGEFERTRPQPWSEGDWRAYAKEYTTLAERWLDDGYGECPFGEQRWSNVLRDRIAHFDGERYEIGSGAIMPNHCHLIVRPFDGHALEDSIGAMKGVTARTLNRARGTSGAFWAEESYDRIVRDEEHLWRVVQYVGSNPRRAGLGGETSWRRWVSPEWEAAGWGFRDQNAGDGRAGVPVLRNEVRRGHTP